MNGSVIQSFMVGLGFGVDESSLAAFNKSISSAAIKVTALYASVQVASAGIFAGISKISEGFEQMGYEYRLLAPAINKAILLRQALMAAYSKAGINIKEAVNQSVVFNFSLAKTKFALEAIYKSVGVKFLPLLTKQMDVFRKQLYANMPKIQAGLERFIKFMFKAFEATVKLGSRMFTILERVYDFFKMLDKATDGWSTVIFGVIAAWKLLNLSFLATPLGLLLTGFVALLALWDDFKTFQEGGESFFNWGSETTKTIVGIIGVLGGLVVAIGLVVAATKLWAVGQLALNAVMALNPLGITIAAVTALIALIGVLAAKMGYLNGVSKSISGIGDKLSGFGGQIMNFLGGPNVAENVGDKKIKGAPPMAATPLGVSNVNNGGNTQHVKQETNITVQGSPNANATGSAIAGEQGRVNFDLARNLKGATR